MSERTKLRARTRTIGCFLHFTFFQPLSIDAASTKRKGGLAVCSLAPVRMTDFLPRPFTRDTTYCHLSVCRLPFNYATASLLVWAHFYYY